MRRGDLETVARKRATWEERHGKVTGGADWHSLQATAMCFQAPADVTRLEIRSLLTRLMQTWEHMRAGAPATLGEESWRAGGKGGKAGVEGTQRASAGEERRGELPAERWRHS